MSDKLNQDKGFQAPGEEITEEEVKKEFKGLIGSVRRFMSELLDIRKNTDQEATKEAIIADIPFKGHTSWILISSIFIASVGLNANSTAVVIGAMLISPLMGPILGIGMSIALNDIDTLRRSLKNFAVMVILSVLTAYLYFWIIPLRDASSELLARTEPDIRDVLIAFFGGLALVIARAKKGTIASVIFGVAIATALMPPLCTVGFGLAIGNWEYAWKAMYLFCINTIFIALATFLVLKILRFPMVRYANSRRRRTIARLASLVGIVVMIPAGITFYHAWKEANFKSQAQELVQQTIGMYQFKDRGRFMENLTTITYSDEGTSTIEVFSMGDENIPQNIIDTWTARKNQFSELQNCELRVVQGGYDDSDEKFEYVNALYEAKKAELVNKDERIRILEEQLANMSQLADGLIPFDEISAEAKANYETLDQLGFAYTFVTNFTKTDTIPVFEVKWKDGLSRQNKTESEKKLMKWLQIRLKNNRIQLREM